MKSKPASLRLHDLLFTGLVILFSSLIAFIYSLLVPNGSTNISLIYILALMLTAKYTEGYWYGICSALLYVISVNYFFTYPHFQIDFTLSGYPITFLFMLAISLIASATTSHMKIQSKLLAEHAEKLRDAEKEKMRANLLRAVSHDLRTPLTSIIGACASFLEDETLTLDKKNELVSQISEDSNWLLNMVENLLSVTRIHDTASKVTKSQEAVEEVTSEAVQRFRKRHPDAQVQVRIPSEFILLPMDPLLIEQVIINLLENAFLHSNSSHPTEVTVTDDIHSITFHIRDFGKGIDPSRLLTLFDGTKDCDARLLDGHRGMGIGLSICRTIIEAHNGTISAKNKELGAEFKFSLPKEEDHEW
ncbi:MAG: DUF4118 domain-containing protein [Lachnospiraceae bacterium]